MADNCDATNALIAHMLAEDNTYAEAYARADDGSGDGDSDYDQPRKKAKKGARQ